MKKDIKDPEKIIFSDTSFRLLMDKRITKVLLVCSVYDAFILEQDGRIDEQLFNEYVSLNLRYPPQFITVHNAEQAIQELKRNYYDLVITMMSIGDMHPFELSKQIKKLYPRKPVVVLTPFNRIIANQIKKRNRNDVDHVFAWLGNTDIMLAIIKLLEDQINVKDDVEIGVQTILLVEDNIRFYSTYLPNIYRIIFQQSLEFTHEGMNEHQKMVRMRGRPKILLATNYEEAIELYDKYKENILGIISDVRYPRNGKLDPQAGFAFVEKVKQEDPFLPIIMQSSEDKNKEIAENLGLEFISKNSPSLARELKKHIAESFGFGYFRFIDPKTGDEIGLATNLQQFQKLIRSIPEDSFAYHIERNHFSRWLNARTLFQIARNIKKLRKHDFQSISEIRNYLNKLISSYRLNKVRGVIAEFDKDKFDNFFMFSRIGQGSIGGKARGLAFIDNLIKKHSLNKAFEGIDISIPNTVVLSTDIFDIFMDDNDLYDVTHGDFSDTEILDKFVNAHLPKSIKEDLLQFITVVDTPIAIRSSSLLEDSHYQPFAGIYSTYMIPQTSDDLEIRLSQISIAIKSVYASVYYKDTKSYMKATHNVIDEEKMAIILQEVCGSEHNGYFYPTMSGVARSQNFYPIEPEKSEEGIVNLALGLGKHVVDGGRSLRLSPKHPKKILQLSNPDMALKDTQKDFFGLDLNGKSFYANTDDGVNIKKLPLKEAEKCDACKIAFSTYDIENHKVIPGFKTGQKIVTFDNIFKYNKYPIAEVLSTLLCTSQDAINNAIEIEFAINTDVPKGEKIQFKFLQIRPIVESSDTHEFDITKLEDDKCIVKSYSALGNGKISGINNIVYVDPETFDASKTREIAIEIENINKKMIENDKNFILIGPGRWGSSDPWLGIPTKWAQISAAKLIIESGLKNFRIDPSQGTHFFQNLTSFNVGYFTINPFIKDGLYNINLLEEMDVIEQTQWVKWVKSPKPIDIYIDGKHRHGAIVIKDKKATK